MKGLTLTQPWASLVAIGAKQFETRSWSTLYRGPIAIHAGKGLGGLGQGATDCDLDRLCAMDPFDSVLGAHFGIETWWEDPQRFPLPRGAIVAVAELVYCLPTEEVAADLEVNALAGADGTHELAFGNYGPGRFAWRFASVRGLAVPVEIPKGAVRDYRGVWDVPPGLEHELIEVTH